MGLQKYVDRISLRLKDSDYLVFLHNGSATFPRIAYTVKEYKHDRKLIRAVAILLVLALICVSAAFIAISILITNSDIIYDADTILRGRLLFGGSGIIFGVIIAVHSTSLFWMIKNFNIQKKTAKNKNNN